MLEGAGEGPGRGDWLRDWDFGDRWRRVSNLRGEMMSGGTAHETAHAEARGRFGFLESASWGRKTCHSSCYIGCP